MNTQNHSIECLDRRSDPNDYRARLMDARVKREIDEMRDVLNRAYARSMSRQFTGAALTDFGALA